MIDATMEQVLQDNGVPPLFHKDKKEIVPDLDRVRQSSLAKDDTQAERTTSPSSARDTHD